MYLTADKWQNQLEKRKQLIETNEKEKGLYFQSGFDSAEIRSSLQVFLSMLNEKTGRQIIADIRIRYCKLPALQDEMNKAEL